MLKDLKEGLSSDRKPDITHVRLPFLVYTSRPCTYGSDKYERANYLRPVAPRGYTGTPTREDFERFRKYLRAAMSHGFAVLDAMERHQAGDPELADIEGMKCAAYAVDTDVTPGGKVGASLLPHVAPACSSLMMAICQAVECGLLPADPGTPWRDVAAPDNAPAGRSEGADDVPSAPPPSRDERDVAGVERTGFEKLLDGWAQDDLGYTYPSGVRL